MIHGVHCRYVKPTAIQAQALPAALSGRDVLVSSPTLAYFLQCCPSAAAAATAAARVHVSNVWSLNALSDKHLETGCTETSTLN